MHTEPSDRVIELVRGWEKFVPLALLGAGLTHLAYFFYGGPAVICEITIRKQISEANYSNAVNDRITPRFELILFVHII